MTSPTTVHVPHTTLAQAVYVKMQECDYVVKESDNVTLTEKCQIGTSSEF